MAGVAGALALPALALGVHAPLWLAALVSLAVFGGVWFIASAARPGATAGEEDAIEARSEVTRALLTDALGALDRLDRAQKRITDPIMKKLVADLESIGERVLKDVRANPDRAMKVRRLLTFYLPNAAGIAEGWQTLETRALPSPERVKQTREVMQGLSEVFRRFADDAAQGELQSLDLDLKVVKDAMSSDLEKTS